MLSSLKCESQPRSISDMHILKVSKMIKKNVNISQYAVGSTHHFKLWYIRNHNLTFNIFQPITVVPEDLVSNTPAIEKFKGRQPFPSVEIQLVERVQHWRETNPRQRHYTFCTSVAKKTVSFSSLHKRKYLNVFSVNTLLSTYILRRASQHVYKTIYSVTH